MANNWSYYNEQGDKISVTSKELKALAKSGKITPGTMVESPDGKAAPAKKVKGLTFAPPPQNESVPEPETAKPENEVVEAKEKTPASPPEESVRPKLFVDVDVNFDGVPQTNVVETKIDANTDIAATKDDDLSLTTLHDAAKANNTKAIARLLNAGADVKEQDESKLGETALHVAAQENAIDAVNALIKAGAGIEVKTRLGYTPLYVAALNNAIHAVNALIEAGANVEAEGGTGWTPLHAGARFNSPESIVVLLKSGAVIEAKERNGRTPLHVAVFENAVDAINVLIKAGANIESKDKDGMTPLHYAAGEEDADDAVDILIKAGANIETKNKDGKTPLIIAIENNRTEAIELLRKAGAKEDAEKTQDEGRNDFLQKMIRTMNKNNVNNPVFDGLTLLHLAASADTPEFIIELASKGANIEVKDKDGNTALHVSATVNRPENIVELVKAGADIEAKNSNNATPLYVAAMMGSVAATDALLKAGANVEAKNKSNGTPLQIAVIKNHTEVAELLRQARAKEHNEDILLSRFDEIGINDPIDNTGATRLHLALLRDAPEAIAQLAKMGADLESKTANGSTPLSLAVVMDKVKIVGALLEAGADTETKSSDGLTALHYAAGTGNVDIARMLLKAGADVGAAAPNGLTPLRFAESKNNYQVADLLRNATTQYKTQSIEDMTPKERLTKGARLIKHRTETREQIRALEVRKNNPDEVTFATYFNGEESNEQLGYGCFFLIGITLLIGFTIVVELWNFMVGLLIILLVIAGAVFFGKQIKNHYEKWKMNRLSNFDSALDQTKSELAELNSALSWYDNLPKAERDKFDAAILAEEKRQEEERKRQEQERLRRESICPQCKKEWALSTSWEMVGTNNEFRTELKEEWVQTGRGLTDGFYQKIPIQIQTVVTTEMNVTKCKYCNYRREGTTRENRREIR